MSLGSLLKKARNAKGYTQEDLQRKSKVDKDVISACERGVSKPTDAQLKAMAKVLDIPASGLLDAKKGKKKTTTKTSKTTTKKATTKSTSVSSLTATEKKLILDYRKADTDTKKAVRDMLSGKSDESPLAGLLGGEGLGGVIQDALGNLLK